MKETLYKGKYAIGVYKKIENDNDELVGLYDNAREFAQAFGKGLQNAFAILNNHFSKGHSDLIIDDVHYELAFINMLED